MFLEKYKGKDGKWYIQPRYKRDMPLFMHCANGKDRVKSNQYKNIVHMLMIHGVVSVALDRVDLHKLMDD